MRIVSSIPDPHDGDDPAGRVDGVENQIPTRVENAPVARAFRHRDHHVIDDDHAEVEFVARYRIAGRAVRLHERSRFVREQGRWYYVDGDLR